MSKYLMPILFVLVLVSCNRNKNSNGTDDFELYQQWKDSLTESNIDLSFRGAHISKTYNVGKRTTDVEDTAHIRYYKNGEISEDGNLHYIISVYKGCVYNIRLKTDKKACAAFLLNSYLKRTKCPNNIVKSLDVKDLDDNNIVYTETKDLGAVKFKNGAVSIRQMFNGKFFGNGRGSVNTLRDDRFEGDCIYIIDITDSILYRKYNEYKTRMQDLQYVKEKQREIEIRKQDSRNNSKLESQF